MTVKLNYVSILVSDMARALAFYRILGLPIPGDAEDGHVEIEVDGLRIAWESEALMRELNPHWTRPHGAGRIGVAVQADSPAGVDAAVDRLRAAGHDVPDAFDAPWGQRYATVTDPDGTAVDVFAWQPAPEG
ncbi:catechol 2,3-dioxygenase-like lactoylglutathione lyase family enzyme [Deinococcus metalli]|uniref:Catechol 2,3-dioxygenase-like lactoylglutathione lyase family enzyme n=1 Tax=Deinococcus metalli TaxID=1141878 RepID=A0A7W8NRZ0_9DEIO|nr:VOC family protein [Deinococcus metalli]MBB5378365.1 catechol 2,3-dioxygenase-like lactoylglutathione lyase family enzyme [Deinococcus metalli]GHF59432.1 glyoxalase [Deinococcus metalli]